jgi:acetyl esterase/lipase
MSELTRRELLALTVGVAAVDMESAAAAESASQTTFPLYKGAIPNAIEAPDEEATRDPTEAWPFLNNVSRPTLSVYLPSIPDAKHAAVIICPGGSYRGVSIEKEGHAVARAFNAFGVAAFVLKYRTPSARHMSDPSTGPLQDAQQAMYIVRERAREWNVDPQRVGIVGFSAGGHLAASVSTLFAQPILGEHKREQVEADFSVLVYPVISMQEGLAHAGSREQLLGTSPSPDSIERFSLERTITDATPPAFLVHAADDATVLVANSLRYFEALNARKIPAQLVVYPRGGHGFGLVNATTSDRWIDRVQLWMASEGWIEQS